VRARLRFAKIDSIGWVLSRRFANIAGVDWTPNERGAGAAVSDTSGERRERGSDCVTFYGRVTEVSAGAPHSVVFVRSPRSQEERASADLAERA
jgi:hypothetical protein